jgi:hypothetical protein
MKEQQNMILDEDGVKLLIKKYWQDKGYKIISIYISSSGISTTTVELVEPSPKQLY